MFSKKPQGLGICKAEQNNVQENQREIWRKNYNFLLKLINCFCKHICLRRPTQFSSVMSIVSYSKNDE